MADVFGRTNVGFGGAFKSTLAAFTLSAKSGGGTSGADISQLLVTNLQANYNQPISRVYELASSKAYFIVGRPEGTGNFGSVFGPKNVTAAAYENLADPCNNNVINLSFNGAATSCEAAGAATKAFSPQFGRQLEGVILQTLGFQVNAQDMLINENVGFQYASMNKVGSV